MTTQAPAIESLLRRLAETPAEFLQEPRLGRAGQVAVGAVVFDVLWDIGYHMSPAEVAEFSDRPRPERNWLRLVLVGAWLAHAEELRGRGGAAVYKWMLETLRQLSVMIDAEQFVTDADRREELARSLLAAMSITPRDESAKQAADRLATVDSLARARVLAETKAQRVRAEELRREMEAQRAREAAARYSRE